MLDDDAVILVTGVSSGLGRAFAEAVVAAGYKVVGTVRSDDDAAQFSALGADAHPLKLDMRDIPLLQPAVQNIEATIGPIAVLVNNAGYGLEGPLEECSYEDLLRQFEVNVFGPVEMMRAVLPSMRQRRRGHIVNVTSMGGMITMPGISFYNGSKFALEGISEAVAKEVAHFGIFVTALAPGQFRTEWAGRSMVRAPRSIADYDAMFNDVRAGRQAKSGKQQGDPAKAGEVLIRLIRTEKPPRHLLMGTDALRFVRDKLGELTAEIDAWEEMSRTTDFR